MGWGRVGWGGGCKGQQSGERGQATQSSNLLPGHSVHVGGPGCSQPAGSGVVLLTSPVDVLEEGHGEGHAQNLKDTGRGPRTGARSGGLPRGTRSERG